MSNWKLVCPLETSRSALAWCAQEGRRHRHLPYLGRRRIRAARQVPAQGRPALAGHRPRQARHLPLHGWNIQLENGGRWRPMSATAAASRSRSMAATSIWPSDRQSITEHP